MADNIENSDTPRRTTRRSSAAAKVIDNLLIKKDLPSAGKKTDCVEIIQEGPQIEVHNPSKSDLSEKKTEPYKESLINVIIPVDQEVMECDSIVGNGADETNSLDNATVQTTAFNTQNKEIDRSVIKEKIFENEEALETDEPDVNHTDITQKSLFKDKIKTIETESTAGNVTDVTEKSLAINNKIETDSIAINETDKTEKSLTIKDTIEGAETNSTAVNESDTSLAIKDKIEHLERKSIVQSKQNGENRESTVVKKGHGEPEAKTFAAENKGEEKKIKASNDQSEVEREAVTDNAKLTVLVPELEEQVNENSTILGSPLTHSKTKIKLNILPKDDGDIVEIPVVKPKIDVIDVLDEEMGDTEVVSEDELPPPPSKEKVDGAEEVSDDELPAAPKPDLPPDGAEEVSDEELPAAPKADLPPEAEDVSDDELLEPVEKKKKIESKSKPVTSSASTDVPVTESKPKQLTEESAVKPVESVESKSTDRKRPLDNADKQDPSSLRGNVVKKPREKSPEKSKALPELQQYWKAVKENPTDFTGWTYLLKYVDQESDLKAAEEAYSAFLSHYPYCYGYWRKYADYERKKGSQAKCEEVFDEGLKAIPLSVDLWIHFLNYVKSVYAEDPECIRKQYQKCVDTCGLEFRADPLWDSYIKWEISQKELIRARELYDRVLKIPLHGKTTHFESFQNFVATNSPKDILPVEEFLALRKEILPSLKKNNDSPVLDDKPPGADDYAPPGEEPAEIVMDVDEANAIRDKIVLSRRKIHKESAQAVTERWPFEERIKRPYFHVKALEKCQLRNWKDYLEFEISKGNEERVEVLFERCLIACALYEEFWYKYICYLKEKPNVDTDKIRQIFTRACTVHHPKKVNIHFEWAAFEEIQGNSDKAREILENIEKEHTELVEIPMRRIALEKRLKHKDNVCKLYSKYLELWKAKQEDHRQYFDVIVKAARYYCIVLKDVDKAVELLKGGLETEKEFHSLQDYTRLNFQLIDSELHRQEIDINQIVSYLDAMLADRTTLTAEQKFLIVTRKLELLEEFGNDIKLINKTVQEFRSLGQQSKSAHEALPVPVVETKEKKEIPTQIISSVRKPKAPLAIDLPPTPAPSVPVHQQPPPPQNVFYPGPPSQQQAQYMAQNQFQTPQAQAPYPSGVPPPPNFSGHYGVDPNNPMVYQQWYGAPNFSQGNWGPYPGNFQGPPPPRRY